MHAVNETGPGGWVTSTKYLGEAPGNWSDSEIKCLLDTAERSVSESQVELQMRGRVIRKKRSVGLVPLSLDSEMPREALDETVLRVQSELVSKQVVCNSLPFCAFNGGRDVWVDVGNKRVGVQILQSYTGIATDATLHIGDQFLNTGNDFAARAVCPCIWITSPEETTYVLKSILRLANVARDSEVLPPPPAHKEGSDSKNVDFSEIERRSEVCKKMDVFTGEMIELPKGN